MSVRLTGMASGLDTDSIVEELVSAYALKVENYEKEKTTLEWTDDAWKDVNSDIYSFYTSQLGTMRYQSSYTMQATTVSDTTKATATSSGSAVNGTQTLNIYSLAKSGYLTGAQLTNATSSASTMTKLAGEEIGTGTISIKVGEETYSFEADGDTTISELVALINDNTDGITATYDSTNKRIFISSDETGADYDFTMVGADTNGTKILQAAGINVSTSATQAYYAEWTDLDTDGDGSVSSEEMAVKLDEILAAQTTLNDAQDAYDTASENATMWNATGTYISYLEAVSEAQTTLGMSDEDFASLKESIAALDSTSDTYDDDYDAVLTTIQDALDAAGDEETSASDVLSTLYTDLTYIEEFEANSEYVAAYDEAVASGEDAATYAASKVDEYTAEMESLTDTITEAQEAYDAYSTFTGYLDEDVDLSDSDQYAAALTTLTEIANAMIENASAETSGTKVDGSDLGIVLNGAVFTSSSNTITINGLTITATALTDSDFDTTSEQTIVDSASNSTNTITITTSSDSSAVYDKIKEFFSEYNTLINGLNSLYNADSAKGYEPLTDEEKDEMSDTEIEKWETKIKDALLRRDSTLGSIINSLANAMAKSYYIKDGTAVMYDSSEGAYYYGYASDGTKNYLTDSSGNTITSSTQLDTYMSTQDGFSKYSLSSFGISTLGVLNAADNEEYAYHIDGDSDDSNTSSNTDKLLAAINSDPDTVAAFFGALFSDTYTTIGNKMSRTTLSSAYTIYNDKEIDNEIEDVEDQIDKWEEKLEELQDYWYSKFSAMETALAELQSQQSSLASLLGSA
ncbi:MAG: flagellar filament capping protein FliD [Eubacterium sp.]|nr:flagellar filament capping protein FliD [Eubacterium sp.]